MALVENKRQRQGWQLDQQFKIIPLPNPQALPPSMLDKACMINHIRMVAYLLAR